MTLIDLSYYYSAGCSDPEVLLQRHAPAIQYVDHLPEGCQAGVVKFLDYEGGLKKGAVDYYFFRGDPSPYWIPLQVHRFIASLHPDVVLLHSLLYPRQVTALRRALGTRVKLLVQHHAETPGGWWQQVLQKRADHCIDGYLFASPGLASPWLQRGIISTPEKVFTAPEGSNGFRLKDKEESRTLTGMKGTPTFLWVGRLDSNKDPLTALEAFYPYSLTHEGARLYMIYQKEDLLKEVKDFILQHSLQDKVLLIGKRLHAEMEAWYNSADYYVSTSHSESYGFSLVEAMACGCFPVVTDIPSFRAITGKDKVAAIFPTGNATALYQQLCTLPPNTAANRQAIAGYFQQHLSHKAMAMAIHSVCGQLTGIKAHELTG